MIYYDKTGEIEGVLFIRTREDAFGPANTYSDTQKEGNWKLLRDNGKITTVDDVLIDPMALSWWSE